MCKPRPSRAFTLIEVLVVVAIIALLVAILLPSLRKAREMSRQTVCAANQKQIMTALFMYCNQNQDQLPYSVPRMNASSTWMGWQAFNLTAEELVLYPHGWVHLGMLYRDGRGQIPDPKVFYCPGYSNSPHIYPEGWRSWTAINKQKGGPLARHATAYQYALNGQVDSYPQGVRMNARLAKLRQQEALTSDLMMARNHETNGLWVHSGGFNAAYADGSARFDRIKREVAKIAPLMKDKATMGERDFFVYALFKSLSGDREPMKVLLANYP